MRAAGRDRRRLAMKRYRILKHPWHTAHDYELSKLPHDWFYLSGTHRAWTASHRPMPSHLRWVPSTRTEPTDVMILDIDQWAMHSPAKRHLFQHYKERYKGPKIVINHGCNMVDGCSSEQMAELVD